MHLRIGSPPGNQALCVALPPKGRPGRAGGRGERPLCAFAPPSPQCLESPSFPPPIDDPQPPQPCKLEISAPGFAAPPVCHAGPGPWSDASGLLELGWELDEISDAGRAATAGWWDGRHPFPNVPPGPWPPRTTVPPTWPMHRGAGPRNTFRKQRTRGQIAERVSSVVRSLRSLDAVTGAGRPGSACGAANQGRPAGAVSPKPDTPTYAPKPRSRLDVETRETAEARPAKQACSCVTSEIRASLPRPPTSTSIPGAPWPLASEARRTVPLGCSCQARHLVPSGPGLAVRGRPACLRYHV